MKESEHSLNNIEKIILLSPAVIGLILILTGIFFFLKRTKSGYHTTGKIIDVKKSIKKITGVKTITHAPVVKYEIKGKEYQTVSYKFFPEDSISFKKGKTINIRVSRRNPSQFVPDETGGNAEKILIGCGSFMIIAMAVMYFRYY